jgi:hypothetical protein
LFKGAHKSYQRGQDFRVCRPVQAFTTLQVDGDKDNIHANSTKDNRKEAAAVNQGLKQVTDISVFRRNTHEATAASATHCGSPLTSIGLQTDGT